jgi:hypothetical protein
VRLATALKAARAAGEAEDPFARSREAAVPEVAVGRAPAADAPLVTNEPNELAADPAVVTNEPNEAPDDLREATNEPNEGIPPGRQRGFGMPAAVFALVVLVFGVVVTALFGAPPTTIGPFSALERPRNTDETPLRHRPDDRGPVDSRLRASWEQP